MPEARLYDAGDFLRMPLDDGDVRVKYTIIVAVMMKRKLAALDLVNSGIKQEEKMYKRDS